MTSLTFRLDFSKEIKENISRVQQLIIYRRIFCRKFGGHFF